VCSSDLSSERLCRQIGELSASSVALDAAAPRKRLTEKVKNWSVALPPGTLYFGTQRCRPLKDTQRTHLTCAPRSFCLPLESFQSAFCVRSAQTAAPTIARRSSQV